MPKLVVSKRMLAEETTPREKAIVTLAESSPGARGRGGIDGLGEVDIVPEMDEPASLKSEAD